MTRPRCAALALGLLLALFGSARASGVDPTGAGEEARSEGGRDAVTADTPLRSGRGVGFTVPAGFSIERREGIVIARTPEEDAAAVVVDAVAADPDAAVAEAWGMYRDDAPTVHLAVDQPGRDGWDAARFYEYETSPNERRTVFAVAQLHGGAWTVLIVDAADAAIERRGAALSLLLSTLRPAGHAAESFAGTPVRRLDDAGLARLDALIELGRAELGVPGVAVAVVQDGRVIHARGHGVREIGEKAPVDPDTLFMIASNTKALSTLLLAQLVDAGALAWDQRVVEVYPAFRLGDAETTAATEVRHLVCACTGLPRRDLDWIFEFAGLTPLDVMGQLADTRPTTRFGETFQYSNLLAAAAGYTAAYAIAPDRELGRTYDAAMKRWIFDPLGMRSTTFDYTRALRGNHAEPHGWTVDGEVVRRPMDVNHAIRPLRPAGGAWSSANDLLAYVRLELDRGVTPAGARIVSEANLLARREHGLRVGDDTFYGMGLFVERAHGIEVVHHGGAMFGFQSDMFWLPEHGVGAVILTNSDQGGLLLAPFRRLLLELLFDGRPEATDDLRAAARALRDVVAADRARITLPPDPAVVAGLARVYTNPSLGTLTVRPPRGSGRALVFDMGEWSAEMATRQNTDGTVSVEAITPGLPLSFVVGRNPDGERTLTVRDAQHEYVFVERATRRG